MARRGHGGIVGRTIACALVRVGWIAVRERRLLRGLPGQLGQYGRGRDVLHVCR